MIDCHPARSCTLSRAASLAMMGAAFLWAFLGAAGIARAQDAPSPADQTPASLQDLFGQAPELPTPDPAATPIPASITDAFDAPQDQTTTSTRVVQTGDSVPEDHDPMIKIVFHNEDGTDEIIADEMPAAHPADAGEPIVITTSDIVKPARTPVAIILEPASEQEGQLYAQALTHIAAGRTAEAERTLRILVEEHPLSPLTPPALYELIRLLKSPIEQLTWCNYFITNYSDSEWAAHVYLIKGKNLAEAGDTNNAITALQWAAETLPDPPMRVDAARMMLQLLVKKRDYQGVLNAYGESPAPSYAPNDPGTQFCVLRALLGLQRWPEALELTGRLMAMDDDFPNRPEVLFARATLLEHASRFSEAQALYESYAAQYPQAPAISLVKARLKSMTGSMWPASAALPAP